MTILETEVWVGLQSKAISYYEDKGYKIPREINKYGKLTVPKGAKIKIKIDDLPDGAEHKVTKICDDCGKTISQSNLSNIIKYRKNFDGRDRCQSCTVKFQHSLKDPSKESLIEFAIVNKKQYLIKEYSVKNKFKINEIFKSSNKLVWWNCPDCKSEYDMEPYKRTLENSNCPYCSGRRVNHTNCLWTTHPHIAKLLDDPEIGYKITRGHNGKVLFKCGLCNHNQLKEVNYVSRNGFKCNKCSDGIPYPEKVMMSVLDELNEKYEYRNTFNWSDNKEYDFYIPSLDLIIETHGEQHYVKQNGFKRSLEEEKNNDKYKFDLAKNNNIEKYIVIDCRNSNIEFIKHNIINSELNNIFDLSNIDWLKCHEFACDSLVKEASRMWNEKTSIVDISRNLKVSIGTVSNYLKQAKQLNWCNYIPKDKSKKGIVKISVIDNNIVDSWNSITEASKYFNVSATTTIRWCKDGKLIDGEYSLITKIDYNKMIKNTQLSVTV